MYLNIKAANRIDSLEKIKNVPLVYYKFKYDTIQDRYQLGIIGPDAFKYFPESIEVVSSKTLFSKDRNYHHKSNNSNSISNSNNNNNSSSGSSNNNNIVLTNFPVVDKNVLFMHGIVTLQELIYKYEQLNNIVNSYDEYSKQLKEDIQIMSNNLNRDISRIEKEKLELLKLEEEAVMKQIILEQRKIDNDKAIILKQIDDEKIQLEYEAKLSKERLLQQEEMNKQNHQEIIRLEKEMIIQKNQYYQQSLLSLSKTKEEQMKNYESSKLEYEKEKISS